MKGVSEIIAVILILMIVIALAALAYTWFSGVFASMTGSANTAITANTQEMTTQFRIEAARYGGTVATGTSVTIRNIGTTSINGSLTGVYIGGAVGTYQSISTGLNNILPQGTAVINNISNSTAGYYQGPMCGNTIMVTEGSGLTDSRIISC